MSAPNFTINNLASWVMESGCEGSSSQMAAYSFNPKGKGRELSNSVFGFSVVDSLSICPMGSIFPLGPS